MYYKNTIKMWMLTHFKKSFGVLYKHEVKCRNNNNNVAFSQMWKFRAIVETSALLCHLVKSCTEQWHQQKKLTA